MAFSLADLASCLQAAGKWTNSRTYLLPLSCIPVVVGAVIIWQASWTHRAAPLIGYYLLAR